MERCFLRALPTHSGESMTMLRFPWRPGDCKLTFGPGNSLQLLETTAALLLIMRGENTRLRGENQLPFQKLAPQLVLNRKKVRKKAPQWRRRRPSRTSGHARRRWTGHRQVSAWPSWQQHLLFCYFLFFFSFYFQRGSIRSVCDGDRWGAGTVIGV